MKTTLKILVVVLTMSGGFTAILAADLNNKVKVEIVNVGLHPGMDPGMYICAAGHLHIKGTVQNLAGVALGHVKVGGKAFDASGKLLGTATASTKVKRLAPNAKAEVDLEFLTVTGSLIPLVKKNELTIIDAPKQ